MNTYYLHNGTENSGPFDLEELKSKKITKTTPVWCEGMEDWKTAGDVAELKSILMVVPPPIKSVPPISKMEKKGKTNKILGLNKNVFFSVSGAFVLIIGTLIFNAVQENRRAEFEQKNNITEKENQQFQLQQKEIEEQKNLIAEQDRIEAERIAKERKQTISNRLSEIQRALVDNRSNLEIKKDELIKATDFKFLRTTTERNEEISSIQNAIDSLKDEIEKLEKETNQLNLELERMH